ncbi:hypothetical protein LWI29_036948 [Acer saccharum]|uniref:Uncharacterized protein n=1 Tax=Acer saccharum TaxID=4024 RepID=A0AA39W650_ACESA|nr:hypothetical protein LWI29_036948 [Acer saccharum]
MPDKVKELIEQVNARESSDKFTCIVEIRFLDGPANCKGDGNSGATFSATAAIWKYNKKQMLELSPTMPTVHTSHFAWPGFGQMKKLFFEYAYTKNKSLQLADWALCNSTYELEHATLTQSQRSDQ